MTHYEVEYSSNNSGGSWWLSDDDWRKLEAAGWKVKWVKDVEWHRGEERFLGALATCATKVYEANSRDGAEAKAIADWQDVTGQSADEHGCRCCGQPHDFLASAVATVERAAIKA